MAESKTSRKALEATVQKLSAQIEELDEIRVARSKICGLLSLPDTGSLDDIVQSIYQLHIAVREEPKTREDNKRFQQRIVELSNEKAALAQEKRLLDQEVGALRTLPKVVPMLIARVGEDIRDFVVSAIWEAQLTSAPLHCQFNGRQFAVNPADQPSDALRRWEEAHA